MAFTLDTTLGTLLDDPQAKAVIDQYLPGVSANPMIAMAKGFTLNMLLAMPQAAHCIVPLSYGFFCFSVLPSSSFI